MKLRRHGPSRRAAAIGGIALCLGLVAVAGCSYVNVRVEMKRGNEAYNTKHYEEAVASYEKVIQLDPTFREAYINLGLAYLSLYQPGSTHEKDIGYSQGAIKAFKEYLTLDPENEKVKTYLIEVCQKSNNTEEAIRFFEDEHRRHPDDVKTITTLGNLYAKLGDIDQALGWMNKRVELEPDNPEAYYTIGVNCWARSYNHMDLSVEERFAILDKGVAALDRAIQLNPDYYEAYTYKNLVLRQKAAFDPSPAQRLIFTQQADELLKKAMEIRNAQLKAAPAESKAGTQ